MRNDVGVSTGSVSEFTDELTQEARELWGKVFSLSSRILQMSRLYSYDAISELAPDPNVSTILSLCRWFDQAFDSVILFDSSIQEIGYENTRLTLNAKQTILVMEKLANALKAKNQTDYENALAELKAQAAF